MQTIKVKTPRSRKALDAQAQTNTTVGDVADRIAEQAMYGGGDHTLAHAGAILGRQSRVLEALNVVGAKNEFELVLR